MCPYLAAVRRRGGNHESSRMGADRGPGVGQSARLGAAAYARRASVRAGAADRRRSAIRIRLAADDTSALRATLESLGFDVLGENAATSTVDVAASSADWQRLDRGGFSIVSIEAARPFRETRRKPKAQEQQQRSGTLVSVEAEATTGYSDLNALLARMTAIANAYPNIAQLVDLTDTYDTPPTAQGRHLYALSISDNVALDEDEPAMLIVAAHHAREISTPEIALYAATQLTTGYGIDPRITAAVDGHEIWIAPLWNPDGYNYVFTTNNMWRKNRRAVRVGHRRRSEPQLPAGLEHVVRRQHQRGVRDLQRSIGRVRSRNPYDDGLVADRALRESDRLPLERREVLYAYRCLSHPFTTWMQQRSDGAVGRIGIRRAHARTERGRRTSAVAVREPRCVRLPDRDAHRVPAALRERARGSGPGVAGHPVGPGTAHLRARPRDRRCRPERRWQRGSRSPTSRFPTARPTAAAALSAPITCSFRPAPTRFAFARRLRAGGAHDNRGRHVAGRPLTSRCHDR